MKSFTTTTRCWILAVMLMTGITTQAQMNSELSYRRYTTQDGLPQMQTERIWQDSQGYIYIGTLSGFVRFDGQTFTPFLKGRRENIVGFLETTEDVRALGFRRQWLTDYDDVKMQPIDPEGRWLLNNFNAGSLPDGYVLLEDEQEENRRLCRVTVDGFTPIMKGALLDQMTPDRKLFMDSVATYIPTERGLYQVKGERAWRLSAKDNIYTLLKTKKILLAFAKDGIYTVSNRGISSRTAFSFKATDYGLIAKLLPNGHLMIADDHTLYEYDGTEVKEVATGFNLVKDMLVDRWGRLWIATYEGAFCFFNCGFTNHQLTDEDDIVRAIGIDGKGQVVMGSLNGKLMIDGRTILEEPGNFYSPSSTTIDGTVYIAGNGDVMRVADGNGQWLHLPQDRYQFVACYDKRLVIGSRKVIVAYDPVSAAIDTISTDIRHPWCAAEDAQGRLWVGSTFGLFHLSKDSGAVKTDYPQKFVISTMDRDEQGNILFASADSLFLIKDGRINSLNDQMPELSGHEIRSLHISPKGYLIVAVIDGLFVSRITQDCTISNTRFLDHTNGFTLLEPQMSTIAETPDGTVWLAGVEQTTSFRPEVLLSYQQKDTFIAPPLRWWQHWWIWILALALLSLSIWLATRWYEKRRNQKEMVKLQGEKLEKERQITAIQKRVMETGQAELAKDIVKMTENTRMTIHTVEGTIVVNTADIAYFKANGNYTQIVRFLDTNLLPKGLGAIEKTLDPRIFIRADRSTIVNIHNISHLDAKRHLCTFTSAEGTELGITLLTPAFKRLESML